MALPLMQLPKTKQFFRGLAAKPGCSLIYADASALEPHVCAYYSRDPGLLSLYKRGAPANDIYTFFASDTPQYRELTEACGYSRTAPTKDAIKRFKSEHSTERQIAKKIILGCNYGMGHNKLHAELGIAGFDIELQDAKDMHAAYWKTFIGIKRFEKDLLQQWKDNRGWILGARGEPITIPKPIRVWNPEERKFDVQSFTKDIVNRFVQRGGHDVHMRFIWHIDRLRKERRIPMTPFHVDLHDSTTWQVPDEYVDEAVRIFKEAAIALNDELGWDVMLKYEPSVATNMEGFLDD